jgi:hypothetical protein
MRHAGLIDSVPSSARAVLEALARASPFAHRRMDAGAIIASGAASRTHLQGAAMQRAADAPMRQKPLSADVAIDGTLMPWLVANCTAALNVDASDCNWPGADCAMYDAACAVCGFMPA